MHKKQKMHYVNKQDLGNRSLIYENKARASVLSKGFSSLDTVEGISGVFEKYSFSLDRQIGKPKCKEIKMDKIKHNPQKLNRK